MLSSLNTLAPVAAAFTFNAPLRVILFVALVLSITKFALVIFKLLAVIVADDVIAPELIEPADKAPVTLDEPADNAPLTVAEPADTAEVTVSEPAKEFTPVEVDLIVPLESIAPKLSILKLSELK